MKAPINVEATPYEIPLFLKALQPFALVAYFAGTFHLVRLYVAHRDAMSKWEPDRTILMTRFAELERSALYYLVWPTLIAFIALGGWVLLKRPDLLGSAFVHVLLGYFAVLLVYHASVHGLYQRLKRGEVKWSSVQLRAWSHVATLFLFVLIVLLIFRERTTWVWGAMGLLAIGGVGMLVFMNVRAKLPTRTDA